MTTSTKVLGSPGVATIVLLGIITAAEYAVSTADVPGLFVFLTVFALMKAAVIVIMFMHLRNVLGEESA